MKTALEKFGSNRLKCDKEDCPWSQIIGAEQDIIVAIYKRGQFLKMVTSTPFAPEDMVEVYHVDCVPEELKERLEKGGM